ncbi:MAG: stealth family protein [Balneolaceae bacterium]
MNRHKSDTEPKRIDAVITWVDGSDPEHRKRRLTALKQNRLNECPDSRTEPVTTANVEEVRAESEPSHPQTVPIGTTLHAGTDEARFSDNGELGYCIAGIRTFAPWIDRIYLVTDGQVPSFLTPERQKELNVRIVDHKVIFAGYEWALPTFNSRTIETAVWRIPDLSPHFIYFNDDFILTGPVRREEFFRDGKVISHGVQKRMHTYGPLRMKFSKTMNLLVKKVLGINRTMHHLQQIRSAQAAGFRNRYFRLFHMPHSLRKTTLETFFRENPELFENNIRYPFRDTNQFSAVFLGSSLEFNLGAMELTVPEGMLMINGETDRGIWMRRKLKRLASGDVRFLCLQSFEQLPEKWRQRIEYVLQESLGLKPV